LYPTAPQQSRDFGTHAAPTTLPKLDDDPLQHFLVGGHHLGPQQMLFFGAQCFCEMLPGQHLCRFG
jgi:hypothetical protein